MRIRKASDSLEPLRVLQCGQERMEEDATVARKFDLFFPPSMSLDTLTCESRLRISG